MTTDKKLAPRERGEQQPLVERLADSVAAHDVRDDTTPPIAWESPDLRAMAPRALRIWTEAHELGRQLGYQQGFRDACQEHWDMPRPEDAARALTRLGIAGIDRAERARKRGSAA